MRFKKTLQILILSMFIFCFSQFYTYTQESTVSHDPFNGPRALFFISEIFETNYDLNEITYLAENSPVTGTTILNFYNAALNIGLPIVPMDINIDELCNIDGYKVIQLRDGRYFVIHNCDGNNVTIIEPPRDPFLVPKDVFQKQWNGITLVFSESLYKQMIEKKLPYKIVDLNHIGPRIVFDEISHHFGITQEGEKLSHIFKFANPGTDTLIVGARPTCRCTASFLSNTRIPPGDSGEILVEFDTTGRTINGITLENVLVTSNDPDNKYINLEIRADMRFEK